MKSKQALKLTAPQLRLLEQLRKGPVRCVDYYPPARGLVARGFAEWRKAELVITGAGALYEEA